MTDQNQRKLDPGSAPDRRRSKAVKIFKNSVRVLVAMAAVAFASPAAAQCSQSDFQCQAAYKCFTGSYTGWGAQNYCWDSSNICTAWRWANYDTYHIPCGTSTRGTENNAMTGIFKPGREVCDTEGKLIELDPLTGEVLQAATSMHVLQRRGAKDDGLRRTLADDPAAAFEAAGIPMPENVGIRVEDNPDDGGSTVTLSADGMDDLEIRYDAAGGLVVEEATPPPGLGRDGE
jgi:hypothetical protein